MDPMTPTETPPAPENPANTEPVTLRKRMLSERIYYHNRKLEPFTLKEFPPDISGALIDRGQAVYEVALMVEEHQRILQATHEGIGVEKARVGALETRLAAIEERMTDKRIHELVMAAYEVRRKQATQPHIPAAFDAPPPSPKHNVITRTKEDLAHELELANHRIERLEHLEASCRRLDKSNREAHDAIVRFITPEQQRLTLAQAIQALGESNSTKAARIKELEKDNRSLAHSGLQYYYPIERCQKMLTEQGEPNESSESSWLPLEERLASFIKRTSEEIALLKKANQAIDGAREKAEKEADALRQQLDTAMAELAKVRHERGEATEAFMRAEKQRDEARTEAMRYQNELATALADLSNVRGVLMRETSEHTAQLATARNEAAFGKAIDRDVNGILDYGGVPRVQPRDSYNPTLKRVRWACDKIAELEKALATAFQQHEQSRSAANVAVINRTLLEIAELAKKWKSYRVPMDEWGYGYNTATRQIEDHCRKVAGIEPKAS